MMRMQRLRIDVEFCWVPAHTRVERNENDLICIGSLFIFILLSWIWFCSIIYFLPLQQH